MCTMAVEMMTTNGFEEQDLPATETIFDFEQILRCHSFVIDRFQCLYLLESVEMMIDHRHKDRRQQDLPKV